MLFLIKMIVMTTLLLMIVDQIKLSESWIGKGLATFTKLVKVRRGKLVLALPSIRFS